MKNMFKEAHKMTKEMVEKYGVDYQAQFGLNLSYLLENKEEKKMLKLKGSEKQVKWAEDIISIYTEVMEGIKEVAAQDEKENRGQKSIERADEVIATLNSIEDAGEIINRFKEVSEIKDEVSRVWHIKRTLKDDFGISITAKHFNDLDKKIWEKRDRGA